MATRPLFDCLLCCSEPLVLRKISKATLAKYAGYQFKPHLSEICREFDVKPLVLKEEAPVPKVKHWSYFKRIKAKPKPIKVEPERSLLRREMAREAVKISFEEDEHDIYDPCYSSDDEIFPTISMSGDNGTRLTVKTLVQKGSKAKKPKKKKQIMTKRLAIAK
mmetsp:Transcript_10720/g.20869  ORF Transcript_10720/g.20869 Transcript_10720/m.20869 type:complete len:163 (-) Transcript_10720:3894-4382(-)